MVLKLGSIRIPKSIHTSRHFMTFFFARKPKMYDYYLFQLFG